MRRTAAATLTTLVAVAGLASACSDGGTTPGAGSGAAPPASEVTNGAEEQPSTCKLAGEQKGEAGVTAGENATTVQFDADPPPSTGTVLYSMTLTDGGDVAVQLGMKIVDGQPKAPFVLDFSTSEQDSLGGEVSVSGGTVSADFLNADLGAAQDADLTDFSAAINVDGSDVATCKGDLG